MFSDLKKLIFDFQKHVTILKKTLQFVPNGPGCTGLGWVWKKWLGLVWKRMAGFGLEENSWVWFGMEWLGLVWRRMAGFGLEENSWDWFGRE